MFWSRDIEDMGTARQVKHVKMLRQIRNYPLVEGDSLHTTLRRHRMKVAQLREEVESLKAKLSKGGGGGGVGGVGARAVVPRPLVVFVD
jgi:hypothetical protein